MGIKWDMTITLGTVVNLAGAVLTAVAVIAVFKAKVDLLLTLIQKDLRAAQQAMLDHAKEDDDRFDKIGDHVFALSGNVQRLIGEMEGIIYNGRQGDRRKSTT